MHSLDCTLEGHDIELNNIIIHSQGTCAYSTLSIKLVRMLSNSREKWTQMYHVTVTRYMITYIFMDG